MLGPGGTMSGMYYDDARGLRKKNRKLKLLQPYTPHIGWLLFSLLAILSLYRQQQAKVLGQSFSSTTQELSSIKTQNSQLQIASSRKDSTIASLNSKVDVIQRDLINTQKRFNEEKALLTKRESELLTAKAETLAAHKDLESRHAVVKQQHTDATGQATTLQQDLAAANARIKELANTLNSQYNSAAELRRNLEAEAALHTNNEGKWQAREQELLRQLEALQHHHKDCDVGATEGSAEHVHPLGAIPHDDHPLLEGLRDRKAQESKPDSNAQSQQQPQQAQQQAHPGMAAAAMAAATNMASSFVGRASSNQSQNATTSSSSSSNSSTGRSNSAPQGQQGGLAGVVKIPWRQVAGLLHGQGITDPQGLEHMTNTLETFVGARLAIERDRREAPADPTAEDEALVNLLQGAGLTDPQGRAHFVAALREHLLGAQPKQNASDAQTDLGSTPTSDPAGDDRGAPLHPVGAVPDDVDASSSADGKQSNTQRPAAGHMGHAHHIASHGRRAFLVDDEKPSR